MLNPPGQAIGFIVAGILLAILGQFECERRQLLRLAVDEVRVLLEDLVALRLAQAELVAEEIQRGVYKVGELLPSESQLTTDFGVSRQTIRAALRNLANAARLIEGQPALATLRFLQTLEASNAGQTFVMNDLSALLPALNARGTKPSASEPAGSS